MCSRGPSDRNTYSDHLLRSQVLGGGQYRELIAVGSLFFLLQLAAQLHAGVDPLIVNELLGPIAVAQFIVVQRPFDLFLVFLLLAMQPLWPAYREAMAVGDVDWIKKTFRRTLFVSLCIALCFSLTMLLFGKRLIELWTHHAALPNTRLLEAYCLSILFSATQAPIAFLLNGLGSVRVQLIIAAPAILLSIVLKVALLPRMGLVSVPITTFAIGVALMIPVQVTYIRHLLRSAHTQAPNARA